MQSSLQSREWFDTPISKFIHWQVSSFCFKPATGRIFLNIRPHTPKWSLRTAGKHCTVHSLSWCLCFCPVTHETRMMRMTAGDGSSTNRRYVGDGVKICRHRVHHQTSFGSEYRCRVPCTVPLLNSPPRMLSITTIHTFRRSKAQQ